MSVQITDCTIRDGGYLLAKNSDPKFVKAIMKGLVEAGIDFVETGYLQTKVTGESLVYANSVDARKFLPKGRGRTEFLGFCDNSRYSPDNLDPYDGKSFKWLRISFAKHEIDGALDFCQKAQDKGYTVQFNPMDAISYTNDERTSLIGKVNKVKPGAMSIVDTFGAMYLEDLIHVFKQMDNLLDKDIKIGLHSHDNLGLSNALAETMIMLAEESGRDVLVDGSLFSMGRGAGNAYTELLASYINEKHNGSYNIPALLDTIEKYIVPLQKKIHWGYDLPMFICGTEHAHVDNVYHLAKKKDCTTRDMYEVIKTMPTSQRTRYGKGYSKNDFTQLDVAYTDYVNYKKQVKQVMETEEKERQMNCSDYLVDYLIKKGITDIFGFSGGYIVPFMDALYSRKDEITVHVCYNEQGCAFAANGYARISGKLGVYFTTSGPGAVNALGGLADAWLDGIPLMGICGNVPTNEQKGYSDIRQNGFQEMDIVSMTRSITKLSVTPPDAEKFPEIISRAYNLATMGRNGGVVIDFPFNVQKASCNCR